MNATSKWHCDFCNFNSIDMEDMAIHLAQCPRNPENKACFTCGNTCNGDQDESSRTSCTFALKGYPKVLGCTKWRSIVIATFIRSVIRQVDELNETFENYKWLAPELRHAFEEFRKAVKEY